mmetsp:Transcript_81312/g.242313  ORF Transcript_81312/g.242313 Transcript_81312/m.242313 type:complete len:316 (-) Transcript_81312:229-1176(-)
MDVAGIASDLRVTVRTLAGKELAFTLDSDALVKDGKACVKRHWGVPVVEQGLILAGTILPNADRIGSHAACRDLQLTMVRGPAFHFNRSLAHPRIKMGKDTAVITHGGQPEYQAAFLSDILSVEGSYTVRFRLVDAGGAEFREMYVGVAPDEPRNWSYLKGAYLNRKGIYVDAFQEPRWHRDFNVWWQIFNKSQQQKTVELQELERSFLGADFGTGSFDVSSYEDWESIEQAYTAASKAESEARKELRKMQQAIRDRPDECTFVLEVNMPGGERRFLTTGGFLVVSYRWPELQTVPVRLCATLGCPGQQVSIVDA